MLVRGHPSINDVASLEGGGGVKLTIWGNMRGVGVKENPISSIQNWPLQFFLKTKFTSGGENWNVHMGRYGGGRGQKWQKIGEVVYGRPVKVPRSNRML